MKISFKNENSGFAIPGDRIWSKNTGLWNLVLRTDHQDNILLTPFRWYHWFIRWFL